MAEKKTGFEGMSDAELIVQLLTQNQDRMVRALAPGSSLGPSAPAPEPPSVPAPPPSGPVSPGLTRADAAAKSFIDETEARVKEKVRKVGSTAVESGLLGLVSGALSGELTGAKYIREGLNDATDAYLTGASAVLFGKGGPPWTEAPVEDTQIAQMGKEAVNTPEGAEAIKQGVVTALTASPPDAAESAAQTILAGGLSGSGVPKGIDFSKGPSVLSTEDVLAKYAQSEPKPPTERDKKDLLMRVVFGMAAGGALGSRGLRPDVGRVLASAGAGGLEQVIKSQDEFDALQREYERSYQRFKREQVGLEVELRQQARKDWLEREQLQFENNVKVYELDMSARTPTHVQMDDAGGILSIYQGGKMTYQANEQTLPAKLFSMKLAEARLALITAGSFEAARPALQGISRSLGLWDNTLEGQFRRTAADAAFNIMTYAVEGAEDILVKAQEEIMDRFPTLSALAKSGDADASNALERSLFLYLYGQMMMNPAQALAIHESMDPAKIYHKLYGGS